MHFIFCINVKSCRIFLNIHNFCTAQYFGSEQHLYFFNKLIKTKCNELNLCINDKIYSFSNWKHNKNQ